MGNKYIEMPHILTSYEFYNTLLPQIYELPVTDCTSIILDFTGTYKVEPLVIPNLLCLGCEIQKRFGKTAILDIPDISYLGKLKNYFYNIGFTHYVEKYGLFEFMYSAHGGLEGKGIDPLCGTLYFGSRSPKDEIARGVSYYVEPFANQYLSIFNNTREQANDIYYSNDITDFLEELIDNCKTHAKIFSFTTMHAKYSAGMIYLAVSDIGCGFLSTVDSVSECKNEYQAIMYSVYKRQNDKKYGLYNIIKKVLSYGGKVRIHSNDTQVIFTPKVFRDFINECLHKNEMFKKYNVKNGISFDGVHIELELPFNGRKKNVFPN